jgi:hypothetical protein
VLSSITIRRLATMLLVCVTVGVISGTAASTNASDCTSEDALYNTWMGIAKQVAPLLAEQTAAVFVLKLHGPDIPRLRAATAKLKKVAASSEKALRALRPGTQFDTAARSVALRYFRKVIDATNACMDHHLATGGHDTTATLTCITRINKQAAPIALSMAQLQGRVSSDLAPGRVSCKG